MNRKIIVLKGNGREVLNDELLNTYLDRFFKTKNPSNKECYNMLLIGPSYHQMINVLAGMKNRENNYHMISLRDVNHTRRVNPLDGIEKGTYNYESVADTIAWYVIGEECHQKINRIMIRHIIQACMVFLSDSDYFKLPHLLGLLTQPIECWKNVLGKHKETSSYISWLLKVSPKLDYFETIIEKLHQGVERIMTDELCWLTDISEFPVDKMVNENKQSIIIVDDDGEMDSALIAALMVECTRQQYDKQSRTSFSEILNPNNLVVIPDISRIRVNKMDLIVGLRNYNPYRLIIGYTRKDVFKYLHSEEEWTGFGSHMENFCLELNAAYKFERVGEREEITSSSKPYKGYKDRVMKEVKSLITT